MAFAAREGG
ncbi:hypothetical protein VCHC39A1_2904, partial [Vibrio cholerae HC-39A1]